jgi:hypothetical protein
VLTLAMLFEAFNHEARVQDQQFVFSAQGKDRGGSRCGFGGRKAPSGMGKISILEVLRLRASSSVSLDRPVTRFAQDDDFVGVRGIPWFLCEYRSTH